MYAIIETGGKQYRVKTGDRVQVEKLPGDVGAKVTLDRVLLLGGTADAPIVGRPLVPGAAVEGEIVAQGRGPKITTFKLKKRKWYRRKIGHRQAYTELKVTAIHKSA
ncbi:MAG: 50S ribosomal protein L21 [Deltaproteobacteria bacterium]|nr:50S ribosomal protein L21 [Deltaproteobacteria bacterium]